MADTTSLKKINKYVIEQLSDKLNKPLLPNKVKIGISSDGTVRTRLFDGVSKEQEVIVSICNHGGLTSDGKKPVGKIRNVFSNCYFLNLTLTRRKILVVTDEEFYTIFKKESDGLLNDIELIYIPLPDELKIIAREVQREASTEMS